MGLEPEPAGSVAEPVSGWFKDWIGLFSFLFENRMEIGELGLNWLALTTLAQTHPTPKYITSMLN
jgi:hypothetical protein